MKTKTYKATAYRQATDPDAKWIVSFVAAAEEVLEWAGIPRRTEDSELAGFQRADNEKRVDKARRYFEIPVNQSPTAIVVGLHPSPEGTEPAVTLKFDDEEGTATIRSCTLTVNYPEDLSEDDAIALIKAQVEHRLTQSPADDDDGGEDEPDESDEDREGEDEEDDGEESDGEIELGRSLLMKLVERLDDEAWCERNAEALLDLAKPATVIDGQHRLKGAERCERNIPFNVCALFDCDWSEQVFQFTVVNYTQKRVPDQFITNNAALSLTQNELGQLQDRLVQAGVSVVEYDLMKVVHFHDRSPFKDLVNLTEKKDPSKIGYKTMVRLARAWYDGRHPLFRMMLPQLYPDIPGKRAHKQARCSLERSRLGRVLPRLLADGALEISGRTIPCAGAYAVGCRAQQPAHRDRTFRVPEVVPGESQHPGRRIL